ATMLAMLVAITLTHLQQHPVKRTDIAVGSIAALTAIVTDVAIMSVAMTVCMAALHRLADDERIPWVASGIVCALLIGMLAFVLARVALQRARQRCMRLLRACWSRIQVTRAEQTAIEEAT